MLWKLNPGCKRGMLLRHSPAEPAHQPYHTPLDMVAHAGKGPGIRRSCNTLSYAFVTSTAACKMCFTPDLWSEFWTFGLDHFV